MLDVATAGNLVQGILACLVRRGVTSRGGLVEVDLLSSAVDLTFEQFTCFLNDGETQPKRHAIGNANPYQPAPYGIYKAQDGYFAFAMTPLAKVAELLDAPQIAQFEAYARTDEIKALVATILAKQPVQHWLNILEPAGVWCAPVLDWTDLVHGEGFATLDNVITISGPDGQTARTTLPPLRIDGARPGSDAPAPTLGNPTHAVWSNRQTA